MDFAQLVLSRKRKEESSEKRGERRVEIEEWRNRGKEQRKAGRGKR